MAIQDLSVDLDLKQNLNIYATCKQFDSLTLIFSIYDNSVLADLNNYNVRLKAMKSDKIPLIQEYTGITILNNVITIVADEQLTTTSGKTAIELQFINKTTGLKKATFNLVLNVVPTTVSINGSISTATYTLLEELENKLDQVSDFTANIQEAIDANTALETTISNGTTVKSSLESDITTGTTLKTNLESNITTGNTTKSNLDTSISNANTSKSNLETTITNANTVKSALETDIATAQSTEFATEIQNARNGEANLDARLDKFDTSLSEKANKSEVPNKNWIINGNFDFWQRGTSSANPAANTLLADRFKINYAISGTSPTTLTHSRQQADGSLVDSRYFYRITSDSAGAFSANDMYRLIQSIENGVRKISRTNKKFTISFKARSSIANKKIGVYANQLYGTGGSPSASEFFTGKYFNLSSEWQKFSLTLDCPDLTNKVFGTNNDDVLNVIFLFAYGSTFASNVGDTVTENFGIGTVDIAQVKIEEGDRVTPFVPRDIAIEEIMCSRYYQVQRMTGNMLGSTQNLAVESNFRVMMRVKPTTRLASNQLFCHNTVANVTFTVSSYNADNSSLMNLLSSDTNLVSGYNYSGLFIMDSEIY